MSKNYTKPAFPLTDGSSFANEGVTKLEWMVGQVAAGMNVDIFDLHSADNQRNYVRIVDILAKSLLNECNKES